MISKDAKEVLYQLYKEYLSRRKSGISKPQAVDFGSAESVLKALFPDWTSGNLFSALNELKQNGYLSNSYYDNKITRCELTNSAIVLMENQKKDTLKSVLDFVAKFVP